MKKTITSLLVGIMVFGMLSGCGNTSRVQEDLEEMRREEEEMRRRKAKKLKKR